jgi:hypothetical protein
MSDEGSELLVTSVEPDQPSDVGQVPGGDSRSTHLVSAPTSQLTADVVTANLMKLGTLSLHAFLTPPYHDPPPPEINLTLSYVARPAADSAQEEKRLPAHQSTPLFLLHQVCSQTFGSIEPLRYEFIDEEDGSEGGSFGATS